MNVFLQYIMFCDWGTIFCLEIANCKHVKTLIGNNSEKLAGNNNFVKTCNKPEKLAFFLIFQSEYGGIKDTRIPPNL